MLSLNLNNRKVSIIHADKLRNILRQLKIIPYGEDLNEEFSEFLSLNDNFSNLIVINKLKCSISSIQNCEYFQLFGTEKRNESDVSQAVSKFSKLKTYNYSAIKFDENSKIGRLKSVLVNPGLSNNSHVIVPSLNTNFDNHFKKNDLQIQIGNKMTKLLSKELSEDTIESFESEHISEIDEIGTDNRVMMRKKFGLFA